MSEDFNNNDKDKLINVTRPKTESIPRSNIDASRVSSYTMREQQSLEKLKKTVGGPSGHQGRSGKIKTIVAIILVVVLLLLLVVFGIVLSRTGKSEEETYDIRVSLEIENKSLLTIITDTGKEALRPINPGDRLDISAYARNSNDYRGDVSTGAGTPPNIYVRFRLRLILNYQDRYDVLVPKLTANWYKFDAEVDGDGSNYDDHYYYFCGSVPYQRRIELFSQLTVDGDSITCEDADAGRYGQIQVLVESIEADVNSLSNGIWPTAPKSWIMATIRGDYNTTNTGGGE